MIAGLSFFFQAHMDKIMIGDIMLLIPGLMSTNAIRDVLIGDTLSGIIPVLRLASCRSTGAGIYGRNSFIWEVWTLNTQAIIQLITGAVGSVAFGMPLPYEKQISAPCRRRRIS